MQKICQICNKRQAVLFESVVVNGKSVEYSYCEECYKRVLKSGGTPYIQAQQRIERRGKECDVCGCTVEKVRRNFLFGCAECYLQMREEAFALALKAQGVKSCDFNTKHLLNMRTLDDKPFICERMALPKNGNKQKFKGADECDICDIVRHNVISSRIRLARNIRGLEFPNSQTSTDGRTLNLINGCYEASKGVFDGRTLLMSALDKNKKTALVERHVISLPLANNIENGAVIIEGDRQFGGMAVMVNEEDHVREQCIADGFDLASAYRKICRYDNALLSRLPVAYDEQLGFLTACPTNLGTGMRASVMLFLPALKRAGAIEDALKTFKNELGVTIRGVFGEGSDAAYDMYQISNSQTLCISEREIVEQVEKATVKMCYLERVALEKLVKECHTKLFDGISRSYAVLRSAYTLTSKELMRLIVDVKLGVILGILPLKDMSVLNELIWACTPSSLKIVSGRDDEEARDEMRAKIVREMLAYAE